jgi:hypothetical protein
MRFDVRMMWPVGLLPMKPRRRSELLAGSPRAHFALRPEADPQYSIEIVIDIVRKEPLSLAIRGRSGPRGNHRAVSLSITRIALTASAQRLHQEESTCGRIPKGECRATSSSSHRTAHCRSHIHSALTSCETTKGSMKVRRWSASKRP